MLSVSPGTLFETGAKNVLSGYAQEVPEKLEKLRRIIEDPRTETETLEETRKRANKTMQLIEASINLLLKVSDVQSQGFRALRLLNF
jgi:hypothetical protein